MERQKWKRKCCAFVPERDWQGKVFGSEKGPEHGPPGGLRVRLMFFCGERGGAEAEVCSLG